MSNDPDSFWEGYRGQGTHSGSDQIAHQRGRMLRESELARERQDAEHAAARARAWSQGGTGRPLELGALAGMVVLALLIAAGALVWKARLPALSLAAAVVIAGLVLHGGLALLNAAPRLGATLRQAAVGYGMALAAALAVGAGAWFLLQGGGPNLMPGIETLDENSLARWEPGLLTFALPLAAGVAAGTWWLNRALPPTAIARPARWAGLAGVLILSPAAGSWATRAVLALL